MLTTSHRGWWVLPLLALAGCPDRGPRPRPTIPVTPAPPATQPVAAPAAGPTTQPALDPARLHREAVVIDTHCDATLRLTDIKGYDYGARHSKGHTDLVRMRQGGLDAEFMAVWVYPKLYPGARAWPRAQRMLDAIHATVAANPARARLALTAAQIRGAAAQGKIALLIGVEGAHAIGRFDDEALVLRRVRRLYSRGARYITLTWINSNPLAGSSGDEGKKRGLSPLGRKVVSLMNDLGMMVDLSHVSDPAFFDAISASRLPVLASHSAARALASHHRNLTDEMLRAVAKNRGAVCVNFFSGYLSDRWMRDRVALKSKAEIPGIKPVPLGLLVDHIQHVIKIAGEDHACLGSDFDGVPALPDGLPDVSGLPAITAELARRGVSAQTIRKVLGGNVLRVMEANERGAKK